MNISKNHDIFKTWQAIFGVFCRYWLRKTGAAGAPKAAYVPNSPKTTVKLTAPMTVSANVMGRKIN